MPTKELALADARCRHPRYTSPTPRTPARAFDARNLRINCEPFVGTIDNPNSVSNPTLQLIWRCNPLNTCDFPEALQHRTYRQEHRTAAFTRRFALVRAADTRCDLDAALGARRMLDAFVSPPGIG